MKKLEDFECEKVKVDSVNGGDAPAQTWCDVPDQYENRYDGTDK